MTLRSLKRWLVISAFICIVGGGGIVVIGMSLPLQVQNPEPVDVLVISQPNKEVEPALPNLESVVLNARKKLQRPIVDPPPPPPKIVEKPPVEPIKVIRTPPPGFAVLGTVIEEGKDYAMLQVTPSKFEVAGVGDVLEGLADAQITSVASDEIKLTYQGKVFVLPVPKRKKLPDERGQE